MRENIFSQTNERFNRFSITDLTLSDEDLIRQAVQIYDVSLGQKYIPKEDLLQYIQKPERYVVIGFQSNSKLLGIMLSYVPEDEEITAYQQILQEKEIPVDLAQSKIGLIKSVAVDPLFRHRGIGTALTLEAMRRLFAMSCESFFAVSWVSNKPDSSQPMFEKLGYENILALPNYWTEDSIKQGYSCPNCGNPCHCEAIFYFLDLKERIDTDF